MVKAPKVVIVRTIEPRRSSAFWDVAFDLWTISGARVFLAGSFNGWHPESFAMTERGCSGLYSTCACLARGSHAYKFVVDRRWVGDPENPNRVSDGHGGFNNLIYVA